METGRLRDLSDVRLLPRATRLVSALRLPVFFLLSAFIFSGHFPSTAAAAPAVVRLHAQAAVDQPLIRLHDLAEIVCDDRALRAALEIVVIGKAPEPGLKRIISRAYLLARLSAAHWDPSGLTLEGPAESVVTRNFQTLTRAAVLRAIGAYIGQATSWKPDQVQIQTVRFAETRLPLGPLDVRVLARPSFKIRDRFYLTVEVYMHERRIRTVLVEVVAELWSEVAVAARAISRGDVITSDMVHMERRNLTLLPEDTFLDTQWLLGAVARGTVEPGRPLGRHLIDRPQLVGRGDVVTLVAESAVFRIATKAKARASGKYGDVIEVVNLDSGKSLQGEVIGPRTVRAR